ncbi:MAG: hypothetical protein GWN29_00515, partial [Gammaproteobacteria bacterium]|nr:hypothetical protein [Gammaproteobacteria bacterium]
MIAEGAVIDYVGLPISLLPVSAFLLLLIFMDSYKLVRLRSILATLVVGCATAFVCMHLNSWLLDLIGGDLTILRRYVAPVTEEAVKG